MESGACQDQVRSDASARGVRWPVTLSLSPTDAFRCHSRPQCKVSTVIDHNQLTRLAPSSWCDRQIGLWVTHIAHRYGQSPKLCLHCFRSGLQPLYYRACRLAHCARANGQAGRRQEPSNTGKSLSAIPERVAVLCAMFRPIRLRLSGRPCLGDSARPIHHRNPTQARPSLPSRHPLYIGAA